VRRSVMAVAVDTIAVPLVLGQLPMVPVPGIDGGNRRHLARRLAGNGIDRSAEYDTHEQQQSRKAPGASEGQAKEHLAGSNSGAFTSRHSAFACAAIRASKARLPLIRPATISATSSCPIQPHRRPA